LWCSVLQCVAVCCSVLRQFLHHGYRFHSLASTRCCSAVQCVAVHCSMLQRFLHHGSRFHSSSQPCVAVCCSVLQCVAAISASWKSCPLFAPIRSCRLLQSVAESCRVLQGVAVCLSASLVCDDSISAI